MPLATCLAAAATPASSTCMMLDAEGVPASIAASCIWSAMRSKAWRVLRIDGTVTGRLKVN